MKRILSWIIFSILALVGLAGVIGYGVGLLLVDNHDLFVDEYAAMAAFATVAFVAGSISLLALAGRLPATTRFPNEWVALVLFVVAIGAGFGAVLSDRYEQLAPLLAVVAAAALFGLIARFVVHWSPGGRVGSHGFILPAAWGMVGATTLAIVAQLTIAVMLFAGGLAGLYVADADLMNDLDEWVTEASELSDLSVVQTPTLAVGAMGMLGIVAPLTEELTKFLGVFIVFRRRPATKLSLFLAGAASGLGFAVVETLGYSLMAVDQWPQVMLIRAPVAFIHVAAASVIAVGWYMQRQSGGFWLVSSFVLAVLLHGAWNSLFVSILILAAGFESSESISSGAAMTTLAVVGAMGATLLAAVLWLFGNARTLGRESYKHNDRKTGQDTRPGIVPAVSS